MACDRRFVEPVAESFVCGVCLDVMRNPVSGCVEGHCFCHDCVKAVDKCPICCDPYNGSFVKNRPADDYIQAHTVLCKYGPDEPDDGQPCAKKRRKKDKKRSDGSDAEASDPPPHCVWRGPLSGLQQHLNTNCPFQPIPCKFTAIGCNAVTERHLMAKHEQECDYRPQPCEACKREFPHRELQNHMEECEEAAVGCALCHQEVARKNMQQHTRECCGEAEIACEFAAVGCEEKVKRKDVGKHAKHFSARHMSLMAAVMAGVKEELRKEKEENTVLTERVKKLERGVQQLHAENGAHIVWKLSPAEVKAELPSPPQAWAANLYSEYCADRDGVKWRLQLQVNKDYPAQVGLYVGPDRVPGSKKEYKVTLKQPPKIMESCWKWDSTVARGQLCFVSYGDLVASDSIEFEAKVYDCVHGE